MVISRNVRYILDVIGGRMRSGGLTAARRLLRWALPGVIVCIAVLGVVAPAQGGFGGKPGMIVFSSTFAGDREIFVAAADGSGRVDLTRDPHADITPSWSADGRRIAFASDRTGSMEIYLMNADGSGVAQLTHDSTYADAPRFTADGRYVVYESKKAGNWDIHRIGADGSGELDLTRDRASDRSPAPSARGGLVAFASNRAGSGTHIWIMSVQGRALKQVTRQTGNQFEPAWAPSGGRLAYVSGTLRAGTNLWSVLANGKAAQRLSALHASNQLNPSWSPDGRSIVYQDCRFSSAAPCTLSLMPLGSKPVDISPLRAPFVDSFDGGADPLGHVFETGSGTSTSDEGGQIVETVAANAADGGSPGDLNAGWGTLCKLTGDYDVQADYKLVEWPATNGVTARISDGESALGPQAYRESQTFGENYAAFTGESVTAVPTLDAAGALRVQREGSTAISSYLSGTSWVPISSGPTSLEPAIIDLDASSLGSRFAHQEVKVAWDNLRINSGALSCPEVSWEDDSPDWQATPA
jgi:dipeptidyl aminopeptidase/acylaminoacyl peptidase